MVDHNPNLHILFLEKFEQTKIGDLGALPEIWKSWSTEILSILHNQKMHIYLIVICVVDVVIG